MTHAIKIITLFNLIAGQAVGCAPAEDAANPASMSPGGKADGLDGTTYLLSELPAEAEITGTLTQSMDAARLRLAPTGNSVIEARLSVLRGSPSSAEMMLISGGDAIATSSTALEITTAGSTPVTLEVEHHNDNTFRVELRCVEGDCLADRDDTCGPPLYYLPGTRLLGDIHWDRCEVILEGSLIAYGSSTALRVEPGTEIWAGGSIYLQSGAWLGAHGEAGNPVRFHFDEKPLERRGLNLENSWRTHELRYVDIDGSNHAVHVNSPNIWSRPWTATLLDCVLTGRDRHERDGFGLRSSQANVSVERTLVQEFPTGISMNGEKNEVIDSVVTQNEIGLAATGASTATVCGSDIPEMPFRPADPFVIRSDVYRNSTGFNVLGDNVQLVVRDSNIVENGFLAFDFRSVIPHAGSEVTRSNVLDDTRLWQSLIRSAYRGTVFPFEDNYWGSRTERDDIVEPYCSLGDTTIGISGYRDEPVRDAGPAPEAPLRDEVQAARFDVNSL